MFEALMKQEMAWYDDKENNVGAVCAKLAGETANVQGVRKNISSCSLFFFLTIINFVSRLIILVFSFFLSIS